MFDLFFLFTIVVQFAPSDWISVKSFILGSKACDKEMWSMLDRSNDVLVPYEKQEEK